MDCRDYKDIVSAHVDGTLATEESLEVQAHLDQCPKCKRMFDWETKAATLLKQSLSPLSPRHELKQKVLDQLEQSGDRSHRWFCMPRAWIPALSLVLVVGVIYFALPSRNQRDVFVDTVAHYQRANEDLEHFSETAVANPTARILDLEPWGYHLLVRSVHQAKGRENRVFVYHGQQSDLLVAQELEGESLSPPRGSVSATKSGKHFVSLAKGDINLVAWQDKNMICVLASKLPKDRLIALAEQIATRG